MGLSASQARHIFLTARKSDNEFEAQQINQARLELADEMDRIALKYNDAINNRRLFFVNTDNKGNNLKTLLTYSNITNSIESNGLGSRLTDAYGRFVVTELPAEFPEGETPADYVVDENLKNPEYLEEMLRNTVYLLAVPKVVATDEGNKIEWVNEDWQTALPIEDALYTDDDAVALAEFEMATAKAQSKDKKLELRQTALESEHKAIETELDSIAKVIKDNIDKSFKTFNG